ncbi:hypothetical protein [Streptomyces sp. NPDC048172]|uniref:hypothetical protein n=1 Tax=Streptomyces sp. NPDC048172 TaxID=3365505 RepID=UPI00371F5119
MIRIDQIGHITAGLDSGKYVRVDELPDTPPSYLILMAHDKDFERGCGDYWVEDHSALEQFFSESGWEISWGISPNPQRRPSA